MEPPGCRPSLSSAASGRNSLPPTLAGVVQAQLLTLQTVRRPPTVLVPLPIDPRLCR